MVDERVDIEDAERFGYEGREFRHVHLANFRVTLRVLRADQELPEWVRGYGKTGVRFTRELRRWGRGSDA